MDVPKSTLPEARMVQPPKNVLHPHDELCAIAASSRHNYYGRRSSSDALHDTVVDIQTILQRRWGRAAR
jgi:hypothetical protein